MFDKVASADFAILTLSLSLIYKYKQSFYSAAKMADSTVLYHNGSIFSREGRPDSWILIKNGRVASRGTSKEELEKYKASVANCVNLEGKLLTPGNYRSLNCWVNLNDSNQASAMRTFTWATLDGAKRSLTFTGEGSRAAFCINYSFINCQFK